MAERMMAPDDGSQLELETASPTSTVSTPPLSVTPTTGQMTPENGLMPERASTKLRRMIKGGRLIVAPGVYDGFSARIALDVGFDALYMTGAGTTASRLGAPDLGIAQLCDMRGNAEVIANLDQYVPLIADMDTGFGGPIMNARSVTEYIRSGVAGFHIEDQLEPKRCGHLGGKRVVDLETYLVRVRAAHLARQVAHSDIVLIARTDALQPHGYDEAVRRLKAAYAEGADAGQLEGVTSREMAAQAVKDLHPMPLQLNMVEHGATPLITTKEAQEMGYRIMIFSMGCLAPAYAGIRATLEKLKTEGVTSIPEDHTAKLFFQICGMEEYMMIDEKAGGGMDQQA